jgi:hypothetical protein
MQNLDIVRGSNRIAMLDCENEALCDADILTNARLIAAAPDLLAALEHIDDYLAPQGDEEDVYNYVRAIIKGAISKAQGA